MEFQRFVDPEKIVSHFHIRPGDSVADIGAGSGFLLEPLVRAVGEEGVVYACEIQKNLVDTLHDVVRQKNLAGVQVIWCDVEAPEGTKLRDGAVDIALAVNTLFQFEEKAAAAKEIVRITRAGGKIAVVDWTDSFGGLGPHPGHVVSLDDTRAYFESEGCVYEGQFDAGDHHYGVLFRVV